MRMKLRNVVELNNLLKSIIDNKDLKIDPLLKFKLLGVMKSIETPITNFEVIRNEKIYEYGEEIEKEDGTKLFGIDEKDKETVEKFMNEINKVLDVDVDVTIQKLNATEIFDKGLPSEYILGLYAIIDK